MLRRSFVALFLLVVGLAVPAQAQVALEWKLKKGDLFYVRSVTKYKQKMKAINRDFPQEGETTAVFSFFVENKSDEGLLLKQTIEGVLEKVGDKDPVADDKSTGATFTLLIAPDGEIKKFDGYDAYIRKLAGDDDMARKTIQALVTEESLKRTAKEVFSFLPERKVKEGETWERSVEVPTGPLGQQRFINTYKFEGQAELAGKKVEKIGVTMAIDYKAGKPDPALASSVLSGEMKVEDGKGTIYFNAAEGRLIQIESKMTLKGRMILSVSGTNVEAELQREQENKTAVLSENPIKK
jgi:hypothetical protein